MNQQLFQPYFSEEQLEFPFQMGTVDTLSFNKNENFDFYTKMKILHLFTQLCQTSAVMNEITRGYTKIQIIKNLHKTEDEVLYHLNVNFYNKMTRELSKTYHFYLDRSQNYIKHFSIIQEFY